MPALRAAELEVLFTAETGDIDKAEKKVKQAGEKIEKKPITAKVTADEKEALAGMDRVEKSAKRIVSAKTIATVDANIERAEKSFMRVYERLDYLRSVETELDVGADIKRAEAQMSKVQRQLDGLRSARAVMEIDADTSGAEEAFDSVQDEAASSGDDAGQEFGGAVIAALATIPIAGAVIGIGAAAAKALLDGFNEGLAQEQGRDRLAALTGLDEADAERISRAAGEAYASNFGESIEANMDTARLALQFDLIDEASTTRDSQKVISGLAGIADVLGGDVQRTATAVSTLLASGLAKSADEAFDILATGAREGLDRNEDLLDTMTEYPVVLTRLGLTGEQMLGLLNQGLEAGARNTDVVADALKEFQIRATDASDASAEGFRTIGLDAEDMTAKIARGGKDAEAGLQLVLDRLRETEDPVARNTAAVALFGTKAEDLGSALFNLDLSTAVDELDGVTGAAQRMFDTLADNDATKMEQAQRNIEVATDAIKGALAAGFSEPLGEFADWVSANRGPLTQFLLDLANGAIDFGESVVESVAAGTEGLGEFVSSLSEVVAGLSAIPRALGDTETADALIDLANGMYDFGETAQDAATGMRVGLGGALDEARDKLNDFAEPVVALGYLNDASLQLAGSLDQVGYDATGAKLGIDDLDASNLRASESGKLLEDQIQASVEALYDELDAAVAAGESQENLEERFRNGTAALKDQLSAMGLTEGQVADLIRKYDQVPDDVDTKVSADTYAAEQALNRVKTALNTITPVVRIQTAGLNAIVGQASGHVVEMMGAGGVRGLSPMSPIAQVVPPNTWRVVGDRMDVPEIYAPLDGSARSWSIIAEGIRRMGGWPMADGGVVGAGVAGPREAVFHLYDTSGVLLGTMRGVAQDAVAAADDAFAAAVMMGRTER